MLRILNCGAPFGPSGSKEPLPVATVEPGDVVLLEPANVRNIELRVPEDVLQKYGGYGSSRSPTIGPVEVRGLKAGKRLAVDLLDICPTAPGFTRGGDEWFDELENFISLEGDEALFPGGMRVPLDPMVGVIGVLPADESIEPHTPGEYGGNLDIREVRKGTTVHLRCQRDGGLLYLGDVHAIMGDGEINGTGVEVDAEVLVRLRPGPDNFPPGPVVETPDSWICVASSRAYAEAVQTAVADMTFLMQKLHGLSQKDARTLVGTVGDVRNGCLIGMPGITPREFQHPITLCVVMPKSLRRTDH